MKHSAFLPAMTAVLFLASALSLSAATSRSAWSYDFVTSFPSPEAGVELLVSLEHWIASDVELDFSLLPFEQAVEQSQTLLASASGPEIFRQDPASAMERSRRENASPSIGSALQSLAEIGGALMSFDRTDIPR